ncbi:MAG: Na(+)/H(+) antiporter subunit B [Deltaproteobacteria bacterium]|nr:Na(+)/H(+) antiporter subunit B [Deltaproteobacteria bacterium]
MKKLALALVILCGGLLVSATDKFPAWGDPNSPAATHVSPRYIEKTMEETSVPNIVTSVLADYRGFDTMFETGVVFTAGLACFILLRIFGAETRQIRVFRHKDTDMVIEIREPVKKLPNPSLFQEIDPLWTPHDLIIKTMGRLLVPFIQLFGLYVIAHGHHSPGGGFQGGVILGASIILFALCEDLKSANERVGEQFEAICAAAGVFIYAGTGALCLALGSNFLDYAALSPLLRVDPVAARSLGIFFVEVGVGLTVMATMIIIYANVASEGRYRQGL